MLRAVTRISNILKCYVILICVLKLFLIRLDQCGPALGPQTKFTLPRVFLVDLLGRKFGAELFRLRNLAKVFGRGHEPEIRGVVGKFERCLFSKR